MDRLAQAGGETASREELTLALGYREIDIESRRVVDQRGEHCQ